MTNQSRYRGFFSIDALLSLLPLAMMGLILAQASSELSARSERQFSDQQVFDKVVSAADHTVKIGAAVHGNSIRYPNWVEEDYLTEDYTESLRVRLGLSRLYIGLSQAGEQYRFCIYRLVVVGPERRMGRLFACGE